MSWHILYVMTNYLMPWCIFYVMNFLTSWQTVWTYWRIADVMTCFWRRGHFLRYVTFNGMANSLTSWSQKYVKRLSWLQNASWRQKCTTWPPKYVKESKVRHVMKNMSWCQKICHDLKVLHDVKKFVMMSKIHHSVKKLMTSKGASWQVSHNAKSTS